MQEYREGRASGGASGGTGVCNYVYIRVYVSAEMSVEVESFEMSFTGVFIGSLGEANVNHVTPRALFEPCVKSNYSSVVSFEWSFRLGLLPH